MRAGLIPARPEEHVVHERLLSAARLAREYLWQTEARLNEGLAALTPAERIVAFHLKFGLSNKEICNALGKCEATVKNQVAALLRKLGVPSRTRLVALLWALDLAASQQDEAGESIVVCGSSVRRLAAEECLVGRAAAVRRPASLPALAFA